MSIFFYFHSSCQLGLSPIIKCSLNSHKYEKDCYILIRTLTHKKACIVHPEFVACELSSSFPMMNDDARYRFCNFRPISPTHVPDEFKNYMKSNLNAYFQHALSNLLLNKNYKVLKFRFYDKATKIWSNLKLLVISKVRGKLPKFIHGKILILAK